MCNIAAYYGEKQAAAVLIDMMKREEGYGGGYYSGLATIYNGKLYYAKLTGDIDRLTALTNAADLPGNIGIIHSRSKSGGDDTWAHPFIGTHETIAYVANGSNGILGNVEQQDEYVRRLLLNGYGFTSRSESAVGRYPVLPDGSCTHVSDVMCQLIESLTDKGYDSVAAITKAFCDMPAEIVAVILNTREPDRLTVSRFNMPMMIGFGDNECYLATTAIAFPDGLHNIMPLAPNAAHTVTKTSVKTVPFEAPPAKIEEVTPYIMSEALRLIEAKIRLSDSPVSIGELDHLISPVFASGKPKQTAMTAYEAVRSLQNRGMIETVHDTRSGSAEGISAPFFGLKLK